jgi:hypothetical protein
MKHDHGVVDVPAKLLENEHIDPVCGMTVQADRAAGTHDYNGQLLLQHFVSAEVPGRPCKVPS